MGELLRGFINTIRRLFGWKIKENELPQGLEVFDENGDVVMNTTTKISVIVGRVSITSSSGSFTITSDTFISSTPFVITNAQPELYNSPMTFYENLVGDTLTVNYKGALYDSANPSYFVIGVY